MKTKNGAFASTGSLGLKKVINPAFRGSQFPSVRMERG